MENLIKPYFRTCNFWNSKTQQLKALIMVFTRRMKHQEQQQKEQTNTIKVMSRVTTINAIDEYDLDNIEGIDLMK